MHHTISKDHTNHISSKRAEHAVDLFIQGFSCSECIVMAFADQFNLETDMAAKISSGFGFNAGREKEKTCGVVTGAIMVIGLKYGAGLKQDPYAKDLCGLVVEEFINRFLARRRSVACRKVHLTYKNPESVRHLIGEHAFCAGVTKDAAQIVEELFLQALS